MALGVNMVQTLTYFVDVSWSELVDFLSEEYLALLCKRLHVSREDIARVPFILSNRDNALCFFNTVDLKP